ncbi:hypothetical protein HYPSUDRAFT_215870 [Hypholoma sublateritium FD-334 SS-4]|uniref:Uncharacterized protein n=1 Tax=Hypholoma sublateritium (strain FD-334 SS-4) TaxID=945553 RepID=A0A0D2NTU1_HYPSF|nr:hypothetical protein HYPSUDRAFT_215870 [Hypholoma sublateritium FD-334 SS-4]
MAHRTARRSEYRSSTPPSGGVRRRHMQREKWDALAERQIAGATVVDLQASTAHRQVGRSLSRSPKAVTRLSPGAPARERLRHTQPRVQFAPAEPESPHSGHDDGWDTDPVRDATPPPAAHFATPVGRCTPAAVGADDPRPERYRCEEIVRRDTPDRMLSGAGGTAAPPRAQGSGAHTNTAPRNPRPRTLPCRAMAVAKTTNTGSAGTRRARGAVGTPARGAPPSTSSTCAQPHEDGAIAEGRDLGFANGSCGPDIIHAMELKLRFSSLSIPRVPRDAMYVNEEAAALMHRSGLSGTPPESLCY